LSLDYTNGGNYHVDQFLLHASSPYVEQDPPVYKKALGPKRRAGLPWG